MDDEICDDEELYQKVVELAQNKSLEELEEKIICFFVCGLNEDGDRIITYEDFFITQEDLIKLGSR